MKPLVLGQIARSDHQKIGMSCLHVSDNGVDDVVHLHIRLHGVTLFQEIIPQRCHQSCGSLDDRLLQLFDLGFGQVPNSQVGHRSFGRGEDGGDSGFRKNAGAKESGSGSGRFRVIDCEGHARQPMDRLFDNEDGTWGNRCDLT
jgi:hypothetical protein